LRDQAGAKLVGFYESDRIRSAKVASELRARAFDSLPALLDEIDAAVIVVPTSAHFDVAREALERGIHLLIEKPITKTLDEADALVRRAREKRALLQIGHVERFNRAIRAAMPYFDGPRFVESERLAPYKARSRDVAVVLDLLIHDIDLVHAVVRDRVEGVRAVGVGVLNELDMANSWLEFEGGAVANIKASRVSRDAVRKLRLFQHNGYFSLDLGAGTGEFYRLRRDVDRAELAKSEQSIEKFVERVKLKAPEGEPLKLEHESFISAIESNSLPIVSGEDGRDALAVALRIVEEINKSLAKLRDAQPRQTAGSA
jgi:predicted dehydrogenase